MRLFNTTTYKLEYFTDWSQVPPYAVLSHTWGDDEVVFGDIYPTPPDFELERRDVTALTSPPDDSPQSVNRYANYPHLRRAVAKKSWAKIEGCCKEAEKYGIKYVWVDTICIDKSSSAELTESLNSMWAWYRDAKICFAYLEDVDPPSKTILTEDEDEDEDEVFEGEWDWSCPFEWSDELKVFGTSIVTQSKGRKTSRWFTRGWTLQELIAPREVFFLYRDWSFIGTRAQLAGPINRLTLIPKEVLQRQGKLDLDNYCVAERFLWASRRFTTREEDRAYSLLGLLGVTLPIIYGEGYKSACYRLQEEVFKVTADQSIFAWSTCIPPWEAPEPYNYEWFSAKDTWDDYGELSECTLINCLFTDLFAPSIDAFAVAYDIMTKQQEVPLNASHKFQKQPPTTPSRYIHGTPLQLPMQFTREINVAKYGMIREYIAFLACGPKDSSALCSIRVVHALSEPDRFYRMLPSIMGTEITPRSEIDLDATQCYTMYLLTPQIDTGVLRNFQMCAGKRGVSRHVLDWTSMASILPDYKLHNSHTLGGSVEFVSQSSKPFPSSVIFNDTVDITAVFWDASRRLREGFVIRIDFRAMYMYREEDIILLKPLSIRDSPKLVRIIEAGKLETEDGENELMEYLDKFRGRSNTHGISDVPTIQLPSGAVIAASLSYDNDGKKEALVRLVALVTEDSDAATASGKGSE